MTRIPNRIPFRPVAPTALVITAPTRLALVWLDDEGLVLVPPPPGVDAYGTTIVVVWPSREVVAWHVTAAQNDRLCELAKAWPLDQHDVCVFPDGSIDPRLETMRAVPGFDVAEAVERLSARLCA